MKIELITYCLMQKILLIQQKTITISTEDPQKIEDLQKELQEKTQELEKVKKQAESNIKTDLTSNIRKQNTFGGNYKNGYADGTVEKVKQKILAERKKAKAGTK